MIGAVQYEAERVRGILARAVHVWNAVGAETLRPCIPAAGHGCVHHLKSLCTVGGGAFLIEVDSHIRDVRRPNGVDIQRRIVVRPRRGIHHFTANAAVLPCVVGRLTEFDEGILA